MGGMRHQFSEKRWVEIEAERAEAARQRLAAHDARVTALARKIADMAIDQLVNDVVRPGPVAEERECYDMAREMRAENAALTDLVSQILKAEGVFDE